MTNIDGENHEIINLKKRIVSEFDSKTDFDHTRTSLVLVVICI